MHAGESFELPVAMLAALNSLLCVRAVDRTRIAGKVAQAWRQSACFAAGCPSVRSPQGRSAKTVAALSMAQMSVPVYGTSGWLDGKAKIWRMVLQAWPNCVWIGSGSQERVTRGSQCLNLL